MDWQILQFTDWHISQSTDWQILRLDRFHTNLWLIDWLVIPKMLKDSDPTIYWLLNWLIIIVWHKLQYMVLFNVWLTFTKPILFHNVKYNLYINSVQTYYLFVLPNGGKYKLALQLLQQNHFHEAKSRQDSADSIDFTIFCLAFCIVKFGMNVPQFHD